MVHVGANVGEELGVYLLLGFADVLMIEANPAAIPALTRNVAAINGVAARFDEPMRLAPASRAPGAALRGRGRGRRGDAARDPYVPDAVVR